MDDSAYSDVYQLKLRMSGRWPHALASICNLTPEQMENRHQPCPRCGGVDRYRAFADFKETGGVFCNQCHDKGNSDGFGTIMWMLDIDFPTAKELVVKYLGMTPTKSKKKSSEPKPALDPAKDLRFMPWAPLLAAHFLAAKKGITEASLLAQGCQMAHYKNQTVIVWPIIGADLDVEKPCGYVIMEYKCRKIPVWNHKGEQIDAVEKKVLAGSKPGFVGFDAINKLKIAGMVETVWKCEGLTDQAALWEAMPEHLRATHVVLTTANGAQENPKWQADILSNFNTNVLHDCDQPGQTGATKWSQSIAGRVADGKAVRNIILPYDIEEKHGKDIRDWLSEGNKYGDLLGLVDDTEPIIVARNEDGSAVEDVIFPLHDMIMQRLSLEVLDEDDRGAVRVYSRSFKKICKISQVSQLKHESLIQICGPIALSLISDDPDDEETFSLNTVRQAISLAASSQRKTDREGGETAFLVRQISADQYFAKNVREQLFRYSEGCYRPDGYEFVKRRVKEICDVISHGIEWTSRRAPEVINYLLSSASLLQENPASDVINVKNGLIRLIDGVLIEHAPTHLSSLQLPVLYDPQARCPRIDKFINDVFPEDSQHVAIEIISWLMAPDYSIQKAVLLLGPGGDGKSTYLRLAQEFLGSNNCSSVSLHDLEENRFAKSLLVGKLANICADLPTEDLQGTSIFKALTGYDMITGEEKCKPLFQFRSSARLVFSANSPPRSRDASDGFYDRWIVIPFCNQFRSTDKCVPQSKLIAQLTAPSELSGLLNKALAARNQIISAGAISISKSMWEAHSEFRATTDPFSVWLDNNTCDSPNAYVTKDKLRTAYGESCAAAGRPALGSNQITRQLKRLRPNVKPGQRTIKEKRVQCYVGIQLVDPKPTTQVSTQETLNDKFKATDNAELEKQCEIGAAQHAQLCSESLLPHMEEENNKPVDDTYICNSNRNSEKAVQPVQHKIGAELDLEPGRRVVKL